MLQVWTLFKNRRNTLPRGIAGAVSAALISLALMPGSLGAQTGGTGPTVPPTVTVQSTPPATPSGAATAVAGTTDRPAAAPPAQSPARPAAAGAVRPALPNTGSGPASTALFLPLALIVSLLAGTGVYAFRRSGHKVRALTRVQP